MRELNDSSKQICRWMLVLEIVDKEFSIGTVSGKAFVLAETEIVLCVSAGVAVS